MPNSVADPKPTSPLVFCIPFDSRFVPSLILSGKRQQCVRLLSNKSSIIEASMVRSCRQKGMPKMNAQRQTSQDVVAVLVISLGFIGWVYSGLVLSGVLPWPL